MLKKTGIKHKRSEKKQGYHNNAQEITASEYILEKVNSTSLFFLFKRFWKGRKLKFLSEYNFVDYFKFI